MSSPLALAVIVGYTEHMTTTLTAHPRYHYNGFGFATLEEAEATRTRDYGGWLDGRRKCIWDEETGETR